ncbi:MAG: site-specific integrase [Lachnospiraceae bacterium]|nr:site-specific integrase [Lachnospiraceae bacterium]
MKKQIIMRIEQEMLGILDNAQLERLHYVLEHCMWNVEITADEDLMFQNEYTNEELLSKFLAAKKVEGCSEKTIKYYKTTLKKMLEKLAVHVTHMTTDHLREYLSEYQRMNQCSKVNIGAVKKWSD